MTYDFDILSVTPKAFQTKYANLLERYGLVEHAKEQLAMFRDPDVSSALAGAGAAVRKCFIDSGFTLNSVQSGIAERRFRAEEEDVRNKILTRLRHNLASLPTNASWNGFDLDAFFVAVETAEPAKPERRRFADMQQATLPRAFVTVHHPSRGITRSRPLSTPISGT